MIHLSPFHGIVLEAFDLLQHSCLHNSLHLVPAKHQFLQELAPNHSQLAAVLQILPFRLVVVGCVLHASLRTSP